MAMTGAVRAGGQAASSKTYMWFFAPHRYSVPADGKRSTSSMPISRAGRATWTSVRRCAGPSSPSRSMSSPAVEVTPNFANPFWQVYSFLLLTFTAARVQRHPGDPAGLRQPPAAAGVAEGAAVPALGRAHPGRNLPDLRLRRLTPSVRPGCCAGCAGAACVLKGADSRYGASF